MRSMKLMLLGAVAVSFLFGAGLPVAHAEESTEVGTIIMPDGTQPKQGWSCSRALLFYRTYGASYSYLKRGNGSWLKCYDNIQEDALRGASDVYGVVCVYVYSDGTWRNMTSY